MREAINRKSLIRSIADLFQNTPPQLLGRTPTILDTQLPSTSRDTPDPSPEEEENVGNAEDNYF